MKKYKILKNDTKFINGRTLYRIQALRDVRLYVSEGSLGGYIESEDNLSQSGTCWVQYDSFIGENARVADNALVNDQSRVFQNAVICDSANVSDSLICGSAKICDNAQVSGNSKVFDKSVICDNAVLTCGTLVLGNSKISKNSKINNSFIENSIITDILELFRYSRIVNVDLSKGMLDSKWQMELSGGWASLCNLWKNIPMGSPLWTKINNSSIKFIKAYEGYIGGNYSLELDCESECPWCYPWVYATDDFIIDIKEFVKNPKYYAKQYADATRQDVNNYLKLIKK